MSTIPSPGQKEGGGPAPHSMRSRPVSSRRQRYRCFTFRVSRSGIEPDCTRRPVYSRLSTPVLPTTLECPEGDSNPHAQGTSLSDWRVYHSTTWTETWTICPGRGSIRLQMVATPLCTTFGPKTIHLRCQGTWGQKQQSPSGVGFRRGFACFRTGSKTYAHPSGPRKLESQRLE